MQPAAMDACDELLQQPLMHTPPPEPEKPRTPRPRRPRVFKLPPKFPLLTEEFYAAYCNHLKQLQMARHKVDDSPPGLFPELYLKPRRLDFYGRQLEENMKVNKDLLKRINLIQRTGGFVDCWNKPQTNKANKTLCRYRQRQLDDIQFKNIQMYQRLLIAKSEQPCTKELNEMWRETKATLILNAKVQMMVWVRGGSKIGVAVAELFADIAPLTCKFFLSLVKGDAKGHAYKGCSIFRVVPGLYCRTGDVCKDNGFGCYIPEGEADAMRPENFILKHTVPGTLSMVVNDAEEYCGQFNIIFKPLPQFNKKHVVFGRIVSGPAQFLERISAVGLPLGTTSAEMALTAVGWFTRSGVYHEGQPNTCDYFTRVLNKKR